MQRSELALVAAVAGGAALGATLALAGVAVARNAGAATTAATRSSAAASRPDRPAAPRSARPSTACTPEPWEQRQREEEAEEEEEGAGADVVPSTAAFDKAAAQDSLRQQQLADGTAVFQPGEGGSPDVFALCNADGRDQSQRQRHQQQQRGGDKGEEAEMGTPSAPQRRSGREAGGGDADLGGGLFANPLSLVSPIDARKRSDPYDRSPRTGYLNWDDYFMSVAFLSSQRSKDPNKQVGAVIVSSDNIILSIGYNGFPRGCPDTELPWAKKSRTGDVLETKYPYVVHAEANALLNKNQASVEGARVYVTMFPCNECAKLLIQAGVIEVVFHESKAESIRHHPAVTAPLDGSSNGDGSRPGTGAGQRSGGGGSGDTVDGSGFAFPAAVASSGSGAAVNDCSFRGFGGCDAGPCGRKSGACAANGSCGGDASGGAGGGVASWAAHVAVAAPDAGYAASRRLLELAGVALRQHRLQRLVVVNPT